MNIILVIFDSLRKDCVGVYGSPPWGKVYTPHFDDFAKVNEIYDRRFTDSPPVRTTVQIARFPMGFLIEVDAIAVA